MERVSTSYLDSSVGQLMHGIISYMFRNNKGKLTYELIYRAHFVDNPRQSPEETIQMIARSLTSTASVPPLSRLDLIPSIASGMRASDALKMINLHPGLDSP